MKTRFQSMTVVICGVRPATVTYLDDRNAYAITSPACDFSSLYPCAVYEVRQTFVAAVELCKCLISPVFDDDPDNPRFRDVPRVEVVFESLSLFNDDETDPFGVLNVNHIDGNDIIQCSVSIPVIGVREYFQSISAATKFALYMSSPSKAPLL